MKFLGLAMLLGGMAIVVGRTTPQLTDSSTFEEETIDIDSTEDYEPQHGENIDYGRRKTITHQNPYNDDDINMKLFRETLSRHVRNATGKKDLCRYKRCTTGQECDVQDGKARCVCRKHCKQKLNPICGTDDEYYENHCEMHRQACLAVRDIYDARHKDCFYKASECSWSEMKQYQEMLTQFYQNIMNSAEFRHAERESRAIEGNVENDVKAKIEENNRTKRSLKNKRRRNRKKHRRHSHTMRISDEYDVVNKGQDIFSPYVNNDFDIAIEATTALPVTSEPLDSVAVEQTTAAAIASTSAIRAKATVKEDTLELFRAIQSLVKLDTDEEEIMTKDREGELIKYIFSLFDLDSDGKVGSDEIWEITSLQHLDDILPGPCNLFHALNYGDENNDRTLDISETFKLFNISVLRLRKDLRIVDYPVAYGDHAKLSCGIESEPEPIWRRYGREVQEKNGARISGRILYLNDVTAKHAGNYSCSSRVRPNMTQTTNVKVTFAPRVEVHRRRQHPTLHSSVTVKCHAEGRPQPSIKWERNGQPLDAHSGRYLLMANNTELHFNSVEEEDSAAYTCIAENSAGVGQAVGALYVETEGLQQGSDVSSSQYFIFHQDGISFIVPQSCQTVRSIGASEKVPGLLHQDRLCELNDDDQRKCVWAESVVVGFRFVYAAQPNEDRIIVVDKHLQRVVEVITTDIMPVQLYYVESSDKVIVLCWMDNDRTSSSIQVIHSASVSGTHFAEHILPLAKSGHKAYDKSAYDVYIPPENPFNPSSKYAYITRMNDQNVQVLDLTSLSYGNPIDLSSRECFPQKINFMPVGGLLHVTCKSSNNNKTLHHEITVDVQTGFEVNYQEDSGVTQEYFSYDYSYVIKLIPDRNLITLHNISDTGETKEIMAIRTNFRVVDVHFSRVKYNPGSMIAYMIAENQANIMYVDLAKKEVATIDGATAATAESWPWKQRTRRLTSSGWFGWFLATSGRSGLEILGLNTNEILCRMDQLTSVSSVSWSTGDM